MRLQPTRLRCYGRARVSFDEMRRACAQYRAGGGLILPDLLRLAERVHQAGHQPDRGTVLVATLEGDVHHIGASLLVALLRASGYRVVDLGRQVPVEAIVEAAIAEHAEAVALSALLISTSKQMPACVQALDRRGVQVPVLLGGAAINRAFGRRAGVLPDGRVYAPGAFYCSDVFEGIATLEALREPRQRQALLDRLHAEIEAERVAGASAPAARGAGVARPSQGAARRGDTSAARAGPDRTRAAQRAVDVPLPPYWGARRITADLEAVWQHLDRNTLFRHHWGAFRAKAQDYERIVRERFEPRLAELQAEAARDGWLEALIVSGYWPCRAQGDQLVILDPAQRECELTRLDFPRQPDGERLCLADFFRAGDPDDVVVFQAVSAGRRAAEQVQALQRAGQYVRMLEVNGLASATAEALAEYAHAQARAALGLPPTRSRRFSWGYQACPDLFEQRKVLPLLDAERSIGLRLSRSANLDPEHSTAAMVVHHPDVSYFAVRLP